MKGTCLQFALFGLFVLAACKRKEPTDGHIAPSSYSGWIVVVFAVPNADNCERNKFGGLDFNYDSYGVALVADRPTLGWRKARYYYASAIQGGAVSREVTIGGAEITGRKMDPVSHVSWDYLCSWIGREPEGGKEGAISQAIAKARIRSVEIAP